MLLAPVFPKAPCFREADFLYWLLCWQRQVWRWKWWLPTDSNANHKRAVRHEQNIPKEQCNSALLYWAESRCRLGTEPDAASLSVWDTTGSWREIRGYASSWTSYGNPREYTLFPSLQELLFNCPHKIMEELQKVKDAYHLDLPFWVLRSPASRQTARCWASYLIPFLS